MLKAYDPDGSKAKLLDANNVFGIRVGDILRVTKSDKSTVVGVLIDMHRTGLGSTLLLRTKITGVGVENRLHVYNPDIANIEILRVPRMVWPSKDYKFIREHPDYDTGDVEALMRKQRRLESAAADKNSVAEDLDSEKPAKIYNEHPELRKQIADAEEQIMAIEREELEYRDRLNSK